MKVLLISANTEQINMPVLPLGMACIAAVAQKAGHEVKTINLMMAQDVRTDIEQAVKGFIPEVIGVSVRNIDDQVMEHPKFLLDSVKTVISQCRRISNAPIVLGGAGYSIFPQGVLDFLKADMGVQGEGEQPFNMLLKRLEVKESLSGIPGLCLPTSGLQKKTGFTKHLDDHPLPLPNIHLQLPSVIADEGVWLPIQTRRGCPMNCSYCSTPIIEGRITRKHSVKYVIEFIRRYVESGIDSFFFVDNTFNLPLSYAKALCDQIIASGLTIGWRCILYPWKVDDELVEKMAAAGCKEVALGFESGATEILKRLNKRFSPGDVRRVSEKLKKQGIHRLGFLLLGGPGETKETVKKSLYFADSLETEAMKITEGIRIYPYTDLSRVAVKEGVIERNENLLFPKFYMVDGLRDWLKTTVDVWLEQRPHWRT
jgi:radical SAM superfamily enzyme YgiQ (UPF0313 family)